MVIMLNAHQRSTPCVCIQPLDECSFLLNFSYNSNLQKLPLPQV